MDITFEREAVPLFLGLYKTLHPLLSILKINLMLIEKKKTFSLGNKGGFAKFYYASYAQGF